MEYPGHKNRIIETGIEELKVFAEIYDNNLVTPESARLPNLHSKEVMQVLMKFAANKVRLGDFKEEYISSEMWHETNAQRDGYISRKTCFPEKPHELILSGPHFYVSNPLYKTPRRVCTANGHYDSITLVNISSDYLQRTNYIPSTDTNQYLNQITKVPWKQNDRVTNYFRIASRGMLSQSGERTLISAIIPKHVTHINGVQTTAFKSDKLLISTAYFSSTIIADFFIKSTGRSNLHYTWENFPVLKLREEIILRLLLLNCLTMAYSDLWEANWQENFKKDKWSKEDARLTDNKFSRLTETWTWDIPLRYELERRQALIELDVIASIQMGLTLDELSTIYLVQFPVLNQYEQETYYDRNGRIVFTPNKGLPGVGFSRPEWEQIKDMKSGTVERTIMDDTLPGGPFERTIVYEAPFDRCDREKDYEIAWAEFERRFKNKNREPGRDRIDLDAGISTSGTIPDGVTSAEPSPASVVTGSKEAIV